MSDHDLDAGVDQLTCRLDGLLQAAGVVDRDQRDRLAQHATSLVKILNRHLHRNTVAFAREPQGAGQRIGEPDPDVRRSVRRRGGRQRHAE